MADTKRTRVHTYARSLLLSAWLKRVSSLYASVADRDLTSYKAQLPSTRGTHPDPQAPIDKTTHAPKRYFRLDNFIRSMVYQSLKAQQNTQQLTD
ncbi:MAG: hypothetical protein IJ882_06160 [Paludibacteraceae bacterium]|nr:hypothetical protein [Paludibacteraceae bacterium]MBR2266237.1 hypothetical protein [Paludibacteraceae bacterium]